MSQSKKFQIGEEVINKNTHKQGKVNDLTECTETGKIEHIEVQYKNGLKEWIPVEKVAKLLTEYINGFPDTPKTSPQKFIQD